MSGISPPTVIHAAHDHVWLAWHDDAPAMSTVYNVFARHADEPQPRLVLSHHMPEVGLTAKVTGLSASSEYTFGIQAVELTSGSVRTSQPCRSIMTKAGPDAVMLVGHTPLSPGELVLLHHLQGLGLTVQVVPQWEVSLPIVHADQLRTWAAPSVAAPPKLLVISPSCARCMLQWAMDSATPREMRPLPLPTVVLTPTPSANAAAFGRADPAGKHRMATLEMDEAALAHPTAADFGRLTRATRWALREHPRRHLPELNELFSRQGRRQAATLFSLAPVHAIAGPSLRREYVVALRELAREIAQEARARGHGSSGRRADRQTGDAPPPPCAHCALWPTRPVFGGFSAAVHAMPEVSDADVAAVYREVIARRLAPMRRAGGLRTEHLEAALHLPPARWNARYQIVDGRPYSVGPEPTPINHHHRKRLRGVRQLLHALVATDGPRVPDIDFVLNLGDAPKLIVAPSEEALGHMHRPPECAAPTGCAEFEWTELAAAPHGPFGPIRGSEKLPFCPTSALGNNGSSTAQPPIPLMTATSCLFSYDISFPTAWYDFEASDDEFGRVRSTAAVQFPWRTKRPVAYFRGSIYWYEGHGRTRAFARSLASPDEIDVDWWEQITTTPLESDGQGIFGNISAHAGYKYLLSLEGHTYWSFRLRHLLQLGSAVLHQDAPCHEFWHVLLRPYEHYVPLRRDLSDLRARLRDLRAADADAERMAARATRLAPKLLSRRAVLAYVRELLVQYATLLHDSNESGGGHARPVQLHPLAEPLGPG